MPTPFDTYLQQIAADYQGGKATEHTYRSTLEQLLEALAPHIEASNDPKHIACGAPDFIVERNHVPLGYIETKDVGDDLSKTEKSEQLKRYRTSLHNLILTDYLEFRWYVNGQHKLTTRLATIQRKGAVSTSRKGGGIPILQIDPAGLAQTAQLFNEFYQTAVPTVNTPKELAQRMAALTRIVRQMIEGTLQEEDERGVFHKQLNAFRHYLLPTLKPEEFSDIYAQTMAYGLFAARVNAPNATTFSRAQAYLYLPQANPFLRKLFLDVGEELDGTPVAPFLDDLAALLAHADIESILQDFGKRTHTEDPVVHFYETFLAAYDPHLRETRGVYYTPEPVVQFIVQSIDYLLRQNFQRPLGLADPHVLLLDPATGTATFLYAVIRRIHEIQMAQGQQGAWNDYVHQKLLPRLFGFELLMAPYAVAHLKLGLLLSELGYTFSRHERLGVYLTNTLEEAVTHAETLGLAGYLSEEGNEAALVKNQKPIMVVLGNPPYSGHSANTGAWIAKLLRDYYFVDGAPLGERNPKWLQDDYVKFIRFAQWRIQQTGQGIVAFITNHGYLDNPTFRGMRQQLLQTFDDLYVLDLHGNSKKKEHTPDGGKDENVFDIQQGVAILLAVKHPPTAKTKTSEVLETSEVSSEILTARVHHAHLFGLRAQKYTVLAANAIDSLQWTPIQPTAPFYLFVPQNVDMREEYERGWNITEVMSINSLGITTARDDFAVTFERKTLEKRIADFVSKTESDNQLLQKYELHDTQSWKIAESRKSLRSNYQANLLRFFDYRPFDARWIYHNSALLERDRSDVLNHLHHENNFALVTLRRSRGQDVWNFVFVGEHPIDKSFITSLDNAFVFPLYLYITALEGSSETTRTANLAPAFIQALSEKLGLTFVPDGVGDVGANLRVRPQAGDVGANLRVRPLHVRPQGQTHRSAPTTLDNVGANLHGRPQGQPQGIAPTTFGPEDIFHYAYAVFHSPTYRARYAEFLKIDFPRLPLTSDKTLFAQLAALGAELVALHLMQARTLDQLITTFPISGSNIVERVRYAEQKVWFNAEQYFGNVPESVWNFKVGGYQVCDKWLKDRKGRTLTSDDLTHYQRIVVALQETMRLMGEIDGVITQWPIE